MIKEKLSYDEILIENEKLKKLLADKKTIENELIAAKEKAEENEKKFSMLFNSCPEPLTVTLLEDGRMLMTNEAFLIKSGFTKEEVINKTSLEINAWLSAEDRQRWVDELKRNRSVRSLEIPLRLKNLDVRTFLVSSDIIELDKKPCSINFYVDITENKKAQETLQLKESYLRAIIENQPGLVWLKDLDSRFLSVNDTFTASCGLKEQSELIGKTDSDIWPLEMAHKYLNDDIEIIKSKSASVVEEQIFDKGNYIWFQTYKTPVLDKSGKVIGTTGFALDITNRKNAEIELLKAKEKAEESDQLKTAFLQNMSHEIRTPLNAIIGFSKMLDNPDLQFEKIKNFASIIINSSNHLLSIVTNILTISSLETNQEKINIGEVCINTIIVELLTIYKNIANNQNVSLYADTQLNDQQSEIFTDKTKVTQILSNLLTNALKFTHHGTIGFGYTIEQLPDNVSGEVKPYLQFYVKDSGIGIKAELHDKIFERFRQADLSINKNYGGTGLGLAISKAFTELLGGKISVKSAPGKGSTFYFTVPYNPVNNNFVTNIHLKKTEFSGTILVAEDDEFSLLFIEELFKKMNIQLLHAKDGNEAVEMCQLNQKIDLILMDLKMPFMDGYEAAKIIKSLRPELVIIAQSAYAPEHEREKYQDIFDDYITKPINVDLLKEIVYNHINSKVQE